jgi:hypothetical protein
MAMYLAVVCEEKLAARAAQASAAVVANMIIPWTRSVEVDKITDRIAASC